MADKKRIVLTGCSKGLGRALLDEFVAAGHTVAGCSRSEQQMAVLRARFAGPHRFNALDVSDDIATGEWAADVLQNFGVPDLVINNAAIINRLAPLWEVSAEEFQQLLAINITGVFTVTRHLLPAMISRGHGIIVNMSSGWGRSAAPEVAPYCATKWAIEGMTKSLAKDLPTGMAAIPLSPGVINTDMLRRAWGKSASAFPSPAEWASKAAPYILSLRAADNGQSLTTPS